MSLKRLFLPSLSLLLACGHRGTTDPVERKAPIAVAQPSRVQEFERISVSGTLTPQSASSLVAFQVPGRALKVLFREGEPVRQGQVLAVLDAENLTHALEAARPSPTRLDTGEARAPRSTGSFLRHTGVAQAGGARTAA